MAYLEKQGQAKHQARREKDERAKKRNLQLYIDLWGHGDWDFPQYEPLFLMLLDGWKEHAKHLINRIGVYSDVEILDCWVSLRKRMSKAAAESIEDLEPYPRKKDTYKRFRKYRDDPGITDRSGREDRRQEFLKKEHLKEIRDYLVENHGPSCNCWDCQEDHWLQQELLAEQESYYLDPHWEEDYEDGRSGDPMVDLSYTDDYDPYDCVGDITTCYCPYCRRVRDERKPKELSLEEKLRPLGHYCQKCHGFVQFPNYCHCVEQDLDLTFHPDHYYSKEDLPDALGDC